MIFVESQEFHYMTSVAMFYNSSQLTLVVNTLIKNEIHFVFIQTYQPSYQHKFILHHLGQKYGYKKTNVDPNNH